MKLVGRTAGVAGWGVCALAMAAVLGAGSAHAAASTAVEQGTEMLPARYTVKTFAQPNLSAPLNGEIYAGEQYQTFMPVEGQAFPPYYCETSNPGTSWRPVQLPDGQIGYTSIYCIF